LKKLLFFFYFFLIIIGVILFSGCTSDTAPAPQDELAEIIDEEIKKLAPGQILFNPPQNMTVGRNERVEVRIDKTFDENLSEGLRGRGETQIEDINVGKVMKVQLIGNNFDIEPLSEDEQLVSGIGFTQWEYDIMPKKAGDQIIILKVSTIIILPEGKEKTISIPVFERKINVEVNPIYSIQNFIEINWKWIVSLIVTSGLISWILKKRKLKNRIR